MIAAPWYLFAAGIGLVILGLLAAALRQVLGSAPPPIDPRMSDKQIARLLKEQQRIGIPTVIVYTGLTCVVLSLAWRLVRWFLALAG